MHAVTRDMRVIFARRELQWSRLLRRVGYAATSSMCVIFCEMELDGAGTRVQRILREMA